MAFSSETKHKMIKELQNTKRVQPV